MTGKTLFISAVTDEFASLRRELVEAFDRPGLDAKSQDELYDSGEPTLLKLADYIQKSDAVVHIIGAMAGRVADAAAHARSRDALLERYPDLAAKLPALAVDEYGNPAPLGHSRFSYTQWEAYLALYFDKPLVARIAGPNVERDEDTFKPSPEHRAAQAAHIARLKSLHAHPTTTFADTGRLIGQLYRALLDVIFAARDLPPIFFDVEEKDVAGSTRRSALPRPGNDRLFGREVERQQLRDAWQSGTVRIVALDAMGGAGKTSLVRDFVDWLHAEKDWAGAEAVYAWSFYSQGSNEDRQTGADEFFDDALVKFGYARKQVVFAAGGNPEALSDAEIVERQREQLHKDALKPHDKGQALARLIRNRRVVLVLDGLEPLQYAAGATGGAVAEKSGREGGLKEQGIKALLQDLAGTGRAMVILTTRLRVAELRPHEDKPYCLRMPVTRLPILAALELLRTPRNPDDESFKIGVERKFPIAKFKVPPASAFPPNVRQELRLDDEDDPYEPPPGDDRSEMPWAPARDLIRIVRSLGGHALALNRIAILLVLTHNGDSRAFDEVPDDVEGADDNERNPFRAMQATEIALAKHIVETGHFEDPAEVVAGRELALLYFLGLFDRPVAFERLATVFSTEDAPVPDPADIELAASLPEELADAPNDTAEERQRRRLERKRRWAEVQPVINARIRTLVRRLFAGMSRYADDLRKIIWAIDRLQNQGLVTKRARDGGALDIDCHPLVREYFGKRLEKLDGESFRAAHGRLYDWYRFDGLPKPFRDRVGYGVLSTWTILKPVAEAQSRNATQITKDALEFMANEPSQISTIPNVPPSLIGATPAQLRAAARLIEGPDWNAALRVYLPATEAGMTPLFGAILHGCKAGRQVEAWREVYRPRVERGNDTFASRDLGLYGQCLAALAAFFDQPFKTPSANLSPTDQPVALNMAGFQLRALGRLEDAVPPFEAHVRMSVEQEEWKSAAAASVNLSQLLVTLGFIEEAVSASGEGLAFADRSGDADERIQALASSHAPARLAVGDIAAAEALFRAAEARQGDHQPGSRLYSTDAFQLGKLLLLRGRLAEARERFHWLVSRSWKESKLEVALTKLTGARAALAAGAPDAHRWTTDALATLRDANSEHYVPDGLLAHAEALWHAGDRRAAEEALREAEAIATRGPMPLFMAEAWLIRAQVALAGNSIARARAHRDAAAELIEKHQWLAAIPELAILEAEVAKLEGAGNLAALLDHAASAIRGTPYRDPRTGLTIDGGWWGLWPRLDALLPADHSARPALEAARKAYNDERDGYLAKLDAERREALGEADGEGDADPDIPDAVVRHIVADPDAKDLLRGCMQQNDLAGAPADLPFALQKAIVTALVKAGAIEIGSLSDTPEARERSSWIAHALSRLNPFRRKH